jgi:hypothetical protein
MVCVRARGRQRDVRKKPRVLYPPPTPPTPPAPMHHDPELQLPVVCREQEVAGGRHKRAADVDGVLPVLPAAVRAPARGGARGRLGEGHDEVMGSGHGLQVGLVHGQTACMQRSSRGRQQRGSVGAEGFEDHDWLAWPFARLQ